MVLLDQTNLEIRSSICDAFLICLAILTVPAMAASLYRALDIGWQPVMTLQILVVTGIWTLAVLRRFLPYHVRSISLIAVFIIVGLTGIWSFGLMAGSIAWFVVAPILGTVFFGMRTGLGILFGVIVATGMIGVGTVLGHRLPPFELAAYLTSTPAWALAETSWIIVSGSLVIAVGILNRFFVESMEKSRRDTAALEESERDYRNILDNMVDTFYRADQDGRIVMVSPSVVDINGHSSDELIGEKLDQFYVDENKRLELLELLKESGGKVSKFQTETRNKDGSTGWVSTSARYWTGADGEILGVEGTIRDITENRKAEEALRRSQKMEAVGQLTGGIAHDYNNMLGVIIGNIQLVQGGANLDDKSILRLDKALAAAKRNADLTDKLLGISRTRVRGTRLTSANAFIANLKDIITISAATFIEVDAGLADDLWMVELDTAELEDAILNLAINARDAMPDGGVLSFETVNKTLDERYVRDNPGSRAGDFVMISVSDTGTGMTEEICEQIFDPFFSTKEIGMGTGLGLSTVYAFIQRSGGFIKVYSEPGEGATFQIFLPRAYEHEADTAVRSGETEQDLPPGTETILVVDDEVALVDIAVAYLNDLGYKTYTANNGKQALEALKANPGINMLFSDIIMPGDLDGYQLALAAVQAEPSLKVLLTSGFTNKRVKFMEGDNKRMAKMAANLLSKPYILTELAVAVRRTLDEED